LTVARPPLLAHSAGLTGAATLVSRILGLLRDQVLAAIFGASNDMDAFVVAFRIPNLVRDLFAEGAMSAAFVPTFTERLALDGKNNAWRLANNLLGALLVTTSALVVLGIVFARPLVTLYAGDFARVPGKMDLKRPERVRLEMTIQGKTIVQAYDGKTAWMIMPFLGSPDPQKMSEDDAKDVVEQADMDGSIVDYKAKGNSVELLGKEDVDGSPAYKLKVSLKNGDTSYVYIDTETGLQVKETTKRKQQGSEVEVDSYMTNFKPVNGVLFPYSIENKVGGKSVGQFTIDDIQANVAIDDKIFAMPAAAAKAAPEKEKK